MNFLRQSFRQLSSDRHTDTTTIIHHAASRAVHNKVTECAGIRLLDDYASHHTLMSVHLCGKYRAHRNDNIALCVDRQRCIDLGSRTDITTAEICISKMAVEINNNWISETIESFTGIAVVIGHWHVVPVASISLKGWHTDSLNRTIEWAVSEQKNVSLSSSSSRHPDDPILWGGGIGLKFEIVWQRLASQEMPRNRDTARAKHMGFQHWSQ